MNIAIHIFKKDVSSVRLLLLLWFILGLPLIVLQLGDFSFGDYGNYLYLYAIARYLSLIQHIVLFLILAIIVYNDELIGEKAFWLSRPIACDDLLAAKLIFLAGILLLEMTLAAITLALSQSPSQTIIQDFAKVFLTKASILLVPTAAASITRNFRQYAGLIVVIMLTPPAYYALFASDLNHNSSAVEFRQVTASLLTVIGCAAVVVHQYKRRRTKISCILLAATMVAYLSIG